ncbi:hypothetical protein [Terrisporobacter petrolearius]|uniref:hypothetical protein n=1 Tax=Terrisporobacter petrolearius TaxID=1460447 RepID=UPI0031CC45A2
MKKIEVYECEFCKKLFRTPNKHNCKFNPKLKNCFTCKNFKSWSETEYDYRFGYEAPYPDCKVGCDNWDIDEIKNVNYNMQCEKWEGK